jgi:hypothetical protein
MDYSNRLFRVSSLGHIMAGAIFGKDVHDAAYSKQLDMYGKMMKAEEELENIKNKTTKTYANAEEKVSKLTDTFYLQRRLVEQLSQSIESAEISEGCKTHLMDVWIANEFGRTTRDIKSKYIEKGIEMEDAGLIAYGIVKGWVPEKCTERKDDGFIMGEIDYFKGDTIYDNKSSWDIWTFYKNVKYLDAPNSNPYFWNMQGYMRLWDKPKSKVVYTLLDTPAKLIENEKKRITYDFTGSEEMLIEALAEVEKNLIYSDIPIDRRIIEINIDRDEDAIKKIPLVVKACRNYLNNIKTIYYEVGKS